MTEQPNRENFEGHTEKEQTPEEILDALERAFNEKIRVELTVLEPDGELIINGVFIEGLDAGTLFVAESKSSAVMGIDIKNVKRARTL